MCLKAHVCLLSLSLSLFPNICIERSRHQCKHVRVHDVSMQDNFGIHRKLYENSIGATHTYK